MTESAPASLRVAEELLSAAVVQAQRTVRYIQSPIHGIQNVSNWPEICAAIIALAQSELQPWLRHKPDCPADFDKLTPRCLCGLDAARAMMVKP